VRQLSCVLVAGISVIVVCHAWIALLEGWAQPAVEDLRSGLQQKMRACPAPLYLLLLRATLADDSVDGGLDESG
jgi:hypothetical protein